jgi:hypothetical protein
MRQRAYPTPVSCSRRFSKDQVVENYLAKEISERFANFGFPNVLWDAWFNSKHPLNKSFPL